MVPERGYQLLHLPYLFRKRTCLPSIYDIAMGDNRSSLRVTTRRMQPGDNRKKSKRAVQRHGSRPILVALARRRDDSAWPMLLTARDRTKVLAL